MPISITLIEQIERRRREALGDDDYEALRRTEREALRNTMKSLTGAAGIGALATAQSILRDIPASNIQASMAVAHRMLSPDHQGIAAFDREYRSQTLQAISPQLVEPFERGGGTVGGISQALGSMSATAAGMQVQQEAYRTVIEQIGADQ